ncbi:hypothetical protein PSP6_260001 [Paraburkholderia tropica]|nr:hypothetical protein PSP6_260001 [Paraburkholderia tropica]
MGNGGDNWGDNCGDNGGDNCVGDVSNDGAAACSGSGTIGPIARNDADDNVCVLRSRVAGAGAAS